MDLDVDVARLKVLKADHQSQQYRLEDKLMKYFPAEIEKTQVHQGLSVGYSDGGGTSAAGRGVLRYGGEWHTIY